jgi:hypothetical protein
MIRNANDLGAGIIYLAVGAAGLVLAPRYGMGSALRMGPGYFPAVLSGLLALIGVASLLRSLRGPVVAAPRLAWRPLLFIVLPVIAFGLLLRRAGLIVAVPVLVVGSARASAQFRWLPTLALAAGLTAFSALVFVKALGVPLPIVGAWFSR